jgi:hypothetical protein
MLNPTACPKPLFSKIRAGIHCIPRHFKGIWLYWLPEKMGAQTSPAALKTWQPFTQQQPGTQLLLTLHRNL